MQIIVFDCDHAEFWEPEDSILLVVIVLKQVFFEVEFQILVLLDVIADCLKLTL